MPGGAGAARSVVTRDAGETRLKARHQRWRGGQPGVPGTGSQGRRRCVRSQRVQANDVESQLAELLRKFRILEVRHMPTSFPRASTDTRAQTNRKAYSEDAQGTIRRQRAAIEKLKQDNVALRSELESSTKVGARECLHDGRSMMLLLTLSGRRTLVHPTWLCSRKFCA